MSLFYFHLVDGTDVLLDPEGRDLAGIEEIARAALIDARDIISGDARSGHVRLDQSIIVETGAGEIVHRLPFVEALTFTWPAGHYGAPG